MKSIKFTCLKCKKAYAKWQGQCASCNNWNSIEAISNTKNNFYNRAKTLDEIFEQKLDMVKTCEEAIDCALGGGVVKSSVNLIVGEPGVGKSTLLITMLDKFISKKSTAKALYVSGEEGLRQLAHRSHSLGIENNKIYYLYTKNIDDINSSLEELSPEIIVVDSIQTIRSTRGIQSSGLISQSSDVLEELAKVTKKKNYILFIVGHVNKKGEGAGSKLIEHLVDTVLYCKKEERQAGMSIVPIKNRFNMTSAKGMFKSAYK